MSIFDMYIQEAYNIETIYGRPAGVANKKKLDTDDLEEMKNKLIKCAKQHMLALKDCKNWSSDEDDAKELLKYKLGYCWGDEGSDYIVYSFKLNNFYMFHHENSGLENIKNRKPLSLKYIKDKVDEYNSRYFKD